MFINIVGDYVTSQEGKDFLFLPTIIKDLGLIHQEGYYRKKAKAKDLLFKNSTWYVSITFFEKFILKYKVSKKIREKFCSFYTSYCLSKYLEERIRSIGNLANFAGVI